MRVRACIVLMGLLSAVAGGAGQTPSPAAPTPQKPTPPTSNVGQQPAPPELSTTEKTAFSVPFEELRQLGDEFSKAHPGWQIRVTFNVVPAEPALPPKK